MGGWSRAGCDKMSAGPFSDLLGPCLELFARVEESHRIPQADVEHASGPSHLQSACVVWGCMQQGLVSLKSLPLPATKGSQSI